MPQAGAAHSRLSTTMTRAAPVRAVACPGHNKTLHGGIGQPSCGPRPMTQHMSHGTVLELTLDCQTRAVLYPGRPIF